MNNFKTFSDLNFKAHNVSGQHARLSFPNGYAVSVVFGSMFYSNGEDTYELAVTDHELQLIYGHITGGDVSGYCTADEISALMQQVQELESSSYPMDTADLEGLSYYGSEN